MTIEYEFEHPAEAVYALLTDQTFLTERLEAIGEDPATIQVSEQGDEVVIDLQRAARRDLPAAAAKVIGTVQKFSMKECWRPSGDGWSGDYMIEFDGVPVEVAADFELQPAGDGCVYRITHKPKVSIPLIGKKLQKILTSHVEDGCDSEIDYLVETLG